MEMSTWYHVKKQIIRTDWKNLNWNYVHFPCMKDLRDQETSIMWPLQQHTSPVPAYLYQTWTRYNQKGRNEPENQDKDALGKM